ncbi:MAG: hypothetical protein HZC54_09360 [Verrucomicrobia bacterium]|nr:hypothetical protein [Verrucomicrobiota bacterium]
MRTMLVLTLISLASIASAQSTPVMLEVKPVNRKDNLIHSRSLAITVRNAVGVAANDVKVRWAVVKEAYDLDIPEKTRKNPGQTSNVKVRSKGPPQAYGGEKVISLTPLQSQFWETEPIQSYEGRFHKDPPYPGDSIVGHGVQVLAGGKLVAESYADARHKALFENIHSVADATPEQLKQKKKKKKR